jgi:hypothetical protein
MNNNLIISFISLNQHFSLKKLHVSIQINYVIIFSFSSFHSINTFPLNNFIVQPHFDLKGLLSIQINYVIILSFSSARRTSMRNPSTGVGVHNFSSATRTSIRIQAQLSASTTSSAVKCICALVPVSLKSFLI